MEMKQGENLQSFLFSIFLNDLEEFFISQTVTSLNSYDLEKEQDIYIRIFILLYADDTA